MATKHHTADEIVAKRRQAELLWLQVRSVTDAVC